MSGSERYLDEVTTTIRRELRNSAALRAEAAEELHKPERSARVLGSIMHDFYNCCERVFRRIGAEINGASYGGDAWHKELLFRMTVALPEIRPRVISDDLAADLDEFLSFRHVFRNIYGFELKGDRVTRLGSRLDGVARRFETEIEAFLASLDVLTEDPAS
ncbi:MAG: hypothetical protein OXJ90_01345 [Spirochaetaceae bacterium]|nr:hypothetical protein [Spirochaetaceae bacterium]